MAQVLGQTIKTSKVQKKHRKFGRNAKKCEAYRRRVGKPNGPGQPGNKAGRNKMGKAKIPLAAE
jgi:hypothetical protein